MSEPLELSPSTDAVLTRRTLLARILGAVAALTTLGRRWWPWTTPPVAPPVFGVRWRGTPTESGIYHITFRYDPAEHNISIVLPTANEELDDRNAT